MKKLSIYYLTELLNVHKNQLQDLMLDKQNSECVGRWRSEIIARIKETRSTIKELKSCIKYLKSINNETNTKTKN